MTKDSGTALRQILDTNLWNIFPSTPDEFGPRTSATLKVIFLSFHPYKDHPNLSSYVTWAAILAQIAPGAQKQT
jgi:hypothetical protein